MAYLNTSAAEKGGGGRQVSDKQQVGRGGCEESRAQKAAVLAWRKREVFIMFRLWQVKNACLNYRSHH